MAFNDTEEKEGAAMSGKIAVKRLKDGKVFTSDMSEHESIYEMHFCTSYTQVMIQEFDEDGKLSSKEIICESLGTTSNFIDLIAVQDDDWGEFICEEG